MMATAKLVIAPPKVLIISDRPLAWLPINANEAPIDIATKEIAAPKANMLAGPIIAIALANPVAIVENAVAIPCAAIDIDVASPVNTVEIPVAIAVMTVAIPVAKLPITELSPVNT